MVSISITDTYGRILRTAHFNVVAGNNSLVIDKLAGWVSGYYYLQLQDNKNNTRLIKKLLKTK
jgi:hypothetical protein